ncbi:unnamed protein product, partial [Tuber aestivum]
LSSFFSPSGTPKPVLYLDLEILPTTANGCPTCSRYSVPYVWHTATGGLFHLLACTIYLIPIPDRIDSLLQNLLSYTLLCVLTSSFSSLASNRPIDVQIDKPHIDYPFR